VRVKICGVTRTDDALLAAELGAWAVGFVFWPGSPRYVAPERARTIVDALPASVTAVGVFVDQPVEEVDTIARGVGLGAVQLHGAEPSTYAQSLELPVIKALSVTDALSEASRDAWHDATLLIDAMDPERRGGTGRVVDWTAAADVARRRPVLLAGGLRADNISEAIRIVRPAGVDVSSGVERAPGVKDAALLRALFAALSTAGAREEAR
jgi:phosphoribosylanthranilate isomerase